MKRLLALLVVSFSVLLSSCSDTGNGATIYTTKGAYNLKPQEVIDGLNNEISATGDSRYFIIPDYESSGNKIEIDSGLSLTLSQSNDGYLNEIIVDWGTFRESTARVNTCGLIIGRLIGSISPSDSEEIYTQLDIGATGTPEYTTAAASNGTTYAYEYTLNGMYQTLTIAPTPEK